MQLRHKKCLPIESLESKILLAFDSVSIPGIHFSSPTVFAPLSEPKDRINHADFVDLNNDGESDVVFLHNGGVAASIFSDGQFLEPASSLSLPETLWELKTGDIDNDGIVDAVVRGQATVSILHGESTDDIWSGFRLGKSIDIEANSIALGDVNQDGNLDLILGGVEAAVFTGDGMGGFDNPIRYGVDGGQADFVSLGDADNDGDLDLLFAHESGLDIRRNDEGVFEVLLDSIAGSQLGHTTFVDMNGDNALDLWVGNTSSENSFLTLYHGNGDGTFLSTSTSILTLGPVSDLQIADINDDGSDDVVVGTLDTDHHPINWTGPGGISVILATETGTYHPQIRIAIPSAISLNVADVNGDGAFDISAVHDEGVTTHQQPTDRYFSEDLQLFNALGFSSRSSAVGDLNGDTYPDFVVDAYNRPADRSEIRVYLGKSDGTFDMQSTFVDHFVSEMEIGNFDGNSSSNELRVIAFSTGAHISVFGIDADGQLMSPAKTNFSRRLSVNATADYNGDGILDFASSTRDGPAIWLGSATGTYLRQTTPSARFIHVTPVVYDLNDDEIPDLVATNSDGFDVLIGNGDGSFQFATQKSIKNSDFFFADFDGDSKDDVAYASFGDKSFVEFGRGDGTFGERAEIPAVANARLQVADLNRDGRADVLYLREQELHAFLNGPDGWHDLGKSLLPDYGSKVESIDIDGDGRLEVIITPEWTPSTPQANFHVVNDFVHVDTPLTTTTFSFGRTFDFADFYDTDSDGIGEFVGMTYLQELFIVKPLVEVSCDVDKNEFCDVADLDALLYQGLVDQSPNFDLDGSGVVDLNDRDEFYRQVGSLPGDIDLSGAVDAADLNVIGANWLSNVDSAAMGDVNGDGVVDAIDLNDVGRWWLRRANEFSARRRRHVAVLVDTTDQEIDLAWRFAERYEVLEEGTGSQTRERWNEPTHDTHGRRFRRGFALKRRR